MSALSHDRLADAPRTRRKLEVNLSRNRKQDHTELLDDAAARFSYDACRDQWWNPEDLSLLHGTPLWDQSTEAQRMLLNQLYWVAYYSQIISAEIATIYFNQTSAAGLYGIDDFRSVCDTLDLESSQERAHIAAFKTVAEQVEQAIFGERVFTWPMRGPFEPTMIFHDLSPFRARFRRLQLRGFGLLSAGSAFIASQYLSVRGLRTLKGKMTQQRLCRYHQQHASDGSPIPAQISFFHFMDESFHFNSSTIIGRDVAMSLPEPTLFERTVANQAMEGCQRDHGRISITVQGLFWDDTAAWPAIRRVLTSPAFGMDDREAVEMIRRCYTEDSDALQRAATLHGTAVESYRTYVAPLPWLNARNHDMRIMGRANVADTLTRHREAFQTFARVA